MWWYENVYRQKVSVIIIVTMHTAKQSIKQTVQWLKKIQKKIHENRKISIYESQTVVPN